MTSESLLRSQPILRLTPLEKLPSLLKDTLRKAPSRECSVQCLIGAKNDLEALRMWLIAQHSEFDDLVSGDLANPSVHGWEVLDSLSNTQRSYWKEVERFVLWLVHERATTLSAATKADCLLYMDFLQNIPQSWCSNRRHAKSHVAWKPFRGPFSDAARLRSLKILRGMCAYLVNRRYLVSNPWEACSQHFVSGNLKNNKPKPSRFDASAIEIIRQELIKLVPTSANLRLKMAVSLLRDTGLSIGKLVKARADDLQLESNSITLYRIVIADQTFVLMQNYFSSRGLCADLCALENANAALLGRATDAAIRAPWAPCARHPIDPKAGVSTGALRDQLKLFFQHCAQTCQHQQAVAKQFEHATSHWLR